MEDAKFFQGVDKLETQFHAYLQNSENKELEVLVDKCKALARRVEQMMKGAERKCGTVPQRKGYPHSEELRRAAYKVVRLKKIRTIK